MATLIQIVAEDRPGLLYDLARTISSAGCNIELILIDTQAHKAIDVFYVTADGRKLGATRAAALGESLLAVCQPAAGFVVESMMRWLLLVHIRPVKVSVTVPSPLSRWRLLG